MKENANDRTCRVPHDIEPEEFERAVRVFSLLLKWKNEAEFERCLALRELNTAGSSNALNSSQISGSKASSRILGWRQIND